MNDAVMSSNSSVAVAGYLNGTDWLLIGGPSINWFLGTAGIDYVGMISK
jgi:hypothetical protein